MLACNQLQIFDDVFPAIPASGSHCWRSITVGAKNVPRYRDVVIDLR